MGEGKDTYEVEEETVVERETCVLECEGLTSGSRSARSRWRSALRSNFRAWCLFHAPKIRQL